MKLCMLALASLATLVDSTPQYGDACAGCYPEPTSCNPETIWETQTVVETSVVTETSTVTTTAIETTTAPVTVVTTVYTTVGQASTEQSAETPVGPSVSTLPPSAATSGNLYPSVVPTTASAMACPAPTNEPGGYPEIPYDASSNRTFGCLPGFVCDPPKPPGCTVWADSPADDYVCQPGYCIASPPYSRVRWPEGETGYMPPDEGYFNLNAHAFGLPYSIFSYETIVAEKYGQVYTVTTGDWASATDLSVFPAPSPLAARYAPPPRRAPAVRQRQESGAPTAPAVCFDDCNNCYKEALAIGKSPALCRAGSQFRQDYQQCIACIDANVENGPAIRSVYIDQKFEQFLRFCQGQEPVATNSALPSDPPTGPTASSQPVDATSQLPGETATSVEPIKSIEPTITPGATSQVTSWFGGEPSPEPSSHASTSHPDESMPTASATPPVGTEDQSAPTVNQPAPTENQPVPTSFGGEDPPESAGPGELAPESLLSLPGPADSTGPGDSTVVNPTTPSFGATTRSGDSSAPSSTTALADDVAPPSTPNETTSGYSEAAGVLPTAAAPSFVTGASAGRNIPVYWTLLFGPFIVTAFLGRPVRA